MPTASTPCGMPIVAWRPGAPAPGFGALSRRAIYRIAGTAGVCSKTDLRPWPVPPRTRSLPKSARTISIFRESEPLPGDSLMRSRDAILARCLGATTDERVALVPFLAYADAQPFFVAHPPPSEEEWERDG